ncbi:MAG: transposase [Bacteroidetes bacterium]|nr:transposase [Bacteroidota bacterium]
MLPSRYRTIPSCGNEKNTPQPPAVLPGAYLAAVKNPNGTENIRYIQKDHASTSLSTGLGSWHTITDENGNLLQELSFDPWGTRRNPAIWRAFTGTPPEPLFDRGFSGHEHLYGFQLINMNGRMYDPVVSRMLSPDNFVQAPDNAYVERFFRTIKYEKIYIERPETGKELYQVCEHFIHYYNEKRDHSSIGDVPPMLIYRRAA